MPAAVPSCALDQRWRELNAKPTRSLSEELQFIALDYQRNLLASVIDEQRTEGRALPHRKPDFLG